jgi:hypothetical protein
MTLIEKLERDLPAAIALATNKRGQLDKTRYAMFEPLTVEEVEEICAALRK